MEQIQIEFEERLKEVDTYIAFLQRIETDTNHAWISLLNSNENTNNQIDHTSLEQVLKSATYLLMYNLIESTINLAFKSVLNEISQEKTYSKLNEYIQKLIVCSTLRDKIQDGNQYLNQGLVIQLMLDFIKAINNNKIGNLNFNVLKGTGNLDSRKIRDLMGKLGISTDLDNSERNHVFKIKRMRNDLAHGIKSFSTIGKTLSFRDIQEMRQEMFEVLIKFINRLKQYLNEKEYISTNLRQSIK